MSVNIANFTARNPMDKLSECPQREIGARPELDIASRENRLA
jgi:hypothetical protein